MSSTESSGDLVALHPLDHEDASTMGASGTAVRTKRSVRWRIQALDAIGLFLTARLHSGLGGELLRDGRRYRGRWRHEGLVTSNAQP